MSAREWYICPFCKSDIQKAKEEYGKIPVDKFIEKYKDKLSVDWNGNEDDPSETETVRMDGEEWLDKDGCYHIEHSLNCNNCGRDWNINLTIYPTISKGEKSKLVFKVPSKSGGEDHEVEFNNGDYKCDCVSFKTRKTCNHITIIKKQRDNEKSDKEDEEEE